MMAVALTLMLIRMRPLCMFFMQGNVNRNGKVLFLHVHDIHGEFWNVQPGLMRWCSILGIGNTDVISVVTN